MQRLSAQFERVAPFRLAQAHKHRLRAVHAPIDRVWVSDVAVLHLDSAVARRLSVRVWGDARNTYRPEERIRRANVYSGSNGSMPILSVNGGTWK